MSIKNTFLGILFGLVTCACAQEADSALARVNKRINKLAFLWSQPTTDYEVVFTFKNTIQYVNCLSPLQIIDNSIKNATTEANSRKKSYDAVIIGTSGIDTAIVFLDKAKDNSMAKVKSVDGKFLFAECKPLLNYDVVDKIDIALDKDCLTPHMDRVNKLIVKGNKSKKDYDALIYGISGSVLIKFKK